MSGYVELKVRTTKGLSNKFTDGLVDEIAGVLEQAGYTGTVKCTNTNKEVKFVTPEKPPKLNPITETGAEDAQG